MNTIEEYTLSLLQGRLEQLRDRPDSDDQDTVEEQNLCIDAIQAVAMGIGATDE